MRARSMVALFGIALGCGPVSSSGEAAGAGDSSGAAPSEDGTTTVVSTSDGADETSAPDACPPVVAAATMWFQVDFPGAGEGSRWGAKIERHVDCTVVGGGGGLGEYELFLLCDEDNGNTAVEYEIHFALPMDPFEAWFDGDGQVQLDYRQWWDETKRGQSLRLARDASTRLVAHEESVEHGTVGVCASPPHDARARAEQWLAAFPVTMQSSLCEDPDTIPLLVPTHAGDMLAHPGSYGLLGDDVSFVYPSGSCHVVESGEQWNFSAVLWR